MKSNYLKFLAAIFSDPADPLPLGKLSYLYAQERKKHRNVYHSILFSRRETGESIKVPSRRYLTHSEVPGNDFS